MAAEEEWNLEVVATELKAREAIERSKVARCEGKTDHWLELERSVC